MIATSRSYTTSPPHPMSAELAHRPPSNTTRPSFSKGHKTSFSEKIAWLGRSSVQYTPSKPMRISEPKMVNAFDILQSPRSGTLGSGAIVVRTPQDALSAEFCDEEDEFDINSEVEEDESRRSPTIPASRDLPPIPVEQNEPDLAETADPTYLANSSPLSLSPSIRATLRPSLNNRSSEHSEYPPPVPPLPANITSTPVPPPFDPILLGPLPTDAIDSSKVIVALETGTSTHRTTLKTLTSRPSHLSTYLMSLVRRSDSDPTSIDSHKSEVSTPDGSFNSIFQQHLASSGLLLQASSSVHIFLDRPSAPYAHIMAYLRSAPSTPECPAILPHAVQLISSSTSRLEALLELRDEASYLDLDELQQLCNAEIRHRESIFSHTRVGSDRSLHSVHTHERPVSEPDRSNGPSHETHRDSIVTHRSAPNERGSVAARSTEKIVQPSTSASAPSNSRNRSRHWQRTAPPFSPTLRATPPPGWI